jgi:hypothetical protein
MFPRKLSDVAAAEILALFEAEVSEGLDLEFKRSLPAKNGADPWMTGGRIGDEAKDHLTREIIAFANTDGGTLILGMDEDRKSKRAIAPLWPIPRCKEAANNLHQSIGRRIEPRLPTFECEGIVTDPDGTSGIIIMRTLPSYLAPHRHTQDLHCYVRRSDASEPMSMAEIQEKTKRISRSMKDVDRAFAESADRFYKWIPSEFQATHPVNGVQSIYRGNESGGNDWIGCWGVRITVKPFAPVPADDVLHGDKMKLLEFPILKGNGRQGLLQNRELSVTRTWQQRLRSIERAFEGTRFVGMDRLSSEGQLDRFVFTRYPEEKPPRYMFFGVNELMWNIGSVMWFAHVVRSKSSRPSQSFALELELVHSKPLYLEPYAGPVPFGGQIIQSSRVLFPRYEVGTLDEFDDVLTTVDRDLWNSAGYQPDWRLSIDWPPVP